MNGNKKTKNAQEQPPNPFAVHEGWIQNIRKEKYMRQESLKKAID